MNAVRTHRRLLARLVLVLLVGLAAAEVPLDVAAHVFRFSNTGYVFILLTIFSGVGVLLALRAPANPIGWLFLAFAALILVSDLRRPPTPVVARRQRPPQRGYTLRAVHGERTVPLRVATIRPGSKGVVVA